MATLLPYPNFNATEDCDFLRKTMTDVGSDEEALIAIFCHRSWQQRGEIERTYKQLYSENIQQEAYGETTGSFRRLINALLQTPDEVAASALRYNLIGDGQDEQSIVEIILTRSSEELKDIKRCYTEMYARDLDEDFCRDLSGFLRRLLLSLLNCNRPPCASAPDIAAATIDAKSIYDAGKNKKADEERFHEIFCNRSYTQLRAIFDCYAKDYNKDISDVIKADFRGDVVHALLTVVGIVRNRSAYFASRLYTAMNEANSDQQILWRIIVTRCEIDLADIKAEYARLYGKSLSEAVEMKI